MIETLKEEHGYRLCLDSKTGKHTVVEVTGDWQVKSAMPGDHPSDGGRWFAKDTEAGVHYVAAWYSKGYAQKTYRELVAYRRENGGAA